MPIITKSSVKRHLASEEVARLSSLSMPALDSSLGLFVEDLVACACKYARNTNLLTASHLREAIMRNDKFDFLRDQVASVAALPSATFSTGKRSSNQQQAAQYAREVIAVRTEAPASRKRTRNTDQLAAKSEATKFQAPAATNAKKSKVSQQSQPEPQAKSQVNAPSIPVSTIMALDDNYDD